MIPIYNREYVSKDDAENAIRTLLRYIGEDPDRDGLRETPRRYVAALDAMTVTEKEGQEVLNDIFKVFEAEHDEMVVCKGIRFTSVCEHHLLPFVGIACVGYLPASKQVLGISKLARLVEYYATRLQIQERLATQVAETLAMGLRTKGTACIIEATHSCMQCRGVKQRDSSVITAKLTGAFKDDPATRMEFYSHVNMEMK